MKKIRITLVPIIRSRKFIFAVLVCLVCGGGLWWYDNHEFARFNDSYTTYLNKAAIQQNAAFIPGAAANQLRNQINQTLSQVLASGVKPKDRLQLAHQGLDLIIFSNNQIDAIGEAAPDVEAAANSMDEAASSPGNMFRKAKMDEIVSIAKQELYTIEDIRGLSYRANFQTAEVFNHIIADNGNLTNAYVNELNNDLPAAEEQFNKRQDAYADLQSQMYNIEQAFAAL